MNLYNLMFVGGENKPLRGSVFVSIVLVLNNSYVILYAHSMLRSYSVICYACI